MVFVVRASDVAPVPLDRQFTVLKNFFTICFVWRRPSHVVQLAFTFEHSNYFFGTAISLVPNQWAWSTQREWKQMVWALVSYSYFKTVSSSYEHVADKLREQLRRNKDVSTKIVKLRTSESRFWFWVITFFYKEVWLNWSYAKSEYAFISPLKVSFYITGALCKQQQTDLDY